MKRITQIIMEIETCTVGVALQIEGIIRSKKMLKHANQCSYDQIEEVVEDVVTTFLFTPQS